METEYAEWSRRCYLERVGPRLRTARSRARGGDDTLAWFESCEPGPGRESRYRLFPGALFLLWLEVLGDTSSEASAESVAAALELVHNASLLHDDILDGHTVRRGQSTVFGLRGRASALLGGDALFGAALGFLAAVEPRHFPATLTAFGEAIRNLCAGQLADESDAWADVATDGRRAHWDRTCLGKLAVGNLAARLAAIWSGDPGLVETVTDLHQEYSVVSQILNDMGDVWGFAGYHRLATSGRERGAETRIKPTLPVILAGVDRLEEIADLDAVLASAGAEVSARSARAVATLERLPVTGPGVAVLRDFFTAPRLPSFACEMGAETK